MVSERTRLKIEHKHGVMLQEVRDAVELRSQLQYVWDHHAERGRRAIVSVAIRTRPALVVLYPAADPFGDVYWLGSVYFTDQ